MFWYYCFIDCVLYSSHGDASYSSGLQLFDLERASLAEIQTRIEIVHYNHHSKDEYREKQTDPNEDI